MQPAVGGLPARLRCGNSRFFPPGFPAHHEKTTDRYRFFLVEDRGWRNFQWTTPQCLDIMKATEKEAAIESFDDIYYKVSNVCLRGGIGELYHYKIALPESVTAIYISNYSDVPPAQVPALISSGSMTVGKFFCIKFSEDNIAHCFELSCYINMTYFGTPSLKSNLPSLIARFSQGTPIYKYNILINKTDQDFIVTTATPSIS